MRCSRIFIRRKSALPQAAKRMRVTPIIICLLLLSCSFTNEHDNTSKVNSLNSNMSFTEKEILEQLDLSYNMIPSSYYPAGQPGDIKYNFFLDLEDGYCEIASSRIHLYADSSRWAVVFETSGYHTRAFDAEINLRYVGNCVNYPIDKYPERNYITNSSRVLLIDQAEFQRIENKDGTEMETFELIAASTKEINVRDTSIIFEPDFSKYENYGIKIRVDENPKKLIGFGDLLRYLNETNPKIIAATEDDIRTHIPVDLPKIMTIEKFHYVSVFDKVLPSKQETFQLIAKVLVSRNSSLWKPTLQANNHWSNWESGGL